MSTYLVAFVVSKFEFKVIVSLVKKLLPYLLSLFLIHKIKTKFAEWEKKKNVPFIVEFFSITTFFISLLAHYALPVLKFQQIPMAFLRDRIKAL